MEELEDLAVGNWSDDDAEFSPLEIPELDMFDDTSVFNVWDESDDLFKTLEHREILLNAQHIASNESELDVLPSYSNATTQRTVVDLEENLLSFFLEDVQKRNGENFHSNLNVSSNSLENTNFANSTEISFLEELVPQESSSNPFPPNDGNPLILPSDSFVTAQRMDAENFSDWTKIIDHSETTRGNLGHTSDNALHLKDDLSLQNPNRCHLRDVSPERPPSRQKPNFNGRKRSLSFKYSPGKKLRHPGYTSASETDYTPKTSAVLPEIQNRYTDNIEKNNSMYFKELPFSEVFTDVNRFRNTESEYNQEPQFSFNGDAVSIARHSGINSDSVVSKNLGSGEGQKGSLQTFRPKNANKPLFDCDKGDKKHQREDKLKRHLLTHTEESNTGNEEFKTHTGGKSFKCDVCGKLYSSKYNLNKHLRIHTGEKPFECNFCQKRFVENGILQRHLRIHTGEKPFECNFCQKRFVQNSDLQKHLRIHTGEKPFECNFCQRRFVQSSTLQNHLRIHTGEKPFECNFCQKRFAVNGNLRNHLRIHTGEKRFQCKFCKKGFVENRRFQKHLQTHSEKEVRCEKCGKSYPTNDELEAHRETTLKKSNRCHVCRQCFASKCLLNIHRRNHYGKKTVA